MYQLFVEGCFLEKEDVMKLRLDFSKVIVLLVSGVVLSAGVVVAQQARGTAEILRLKSFVGIGNKNLVMTPEYRSNVARSVNRAQMWQCLAISYDTAPKWIDEITVRYYAMSLEKSTGAVAYTVFKTSVRYVDIKAGTKHLGVAYLHPKAIDRYGDVVAVAVEIISNGEVIAARSEVKGKSIPNDWWKNATVMDSPSVTVKDGYLLAKGDSPFALVNIDDYEFAK